MKAIITGATKGIGRATAIELAKNGYDVIVGARSEQDLKQLTIELNAYNVKVVALKVDFSVKTQVITFVESAMEFAGNVNVLVNNVGSFVPSSFFDEDDEVFESQQLLNVNAAYYLGKRIGKQMLTQRSGHIFNICSVASKAPVENAGSYSVTKAAMLSLNDVMRKELAPHHVKVTAVIPGSTYTSSWEGTTLAKEKFVQPEDVAKSISMALQLSAAANVDEIVLTPLNF
ncbi:SDR family oxidoreductase [Pedobacter sp.]